MAITNLFAKYSYKSGSNLPVILMLQGWGGQASDWQDTTLDRIASYGYFAAGIGMRGRDGASGSKDAAGREIHDIYDGLLQIRARFGGIVSNDKAIIIGGSGGGGLVLGALCKFPDTFVMGVDYYGISDYGRNNPNGWIYNNGGHFYDADISLRVGGDPGVTPNKYYARDTTAAIQNFTGGKLVIFHDNADTTVPVVHSTRITGALDAAGLANYETHYSQAGDAVRWSHGHSWESGIEFEAEAIWVPQIPALTPWAIPASGTITVIGYMITKRFTIWLNQGLDAAATVAYDTVAGTYTITPITSGNVTITITQGGLAASQTISGATTLTVA